MQNKLCHSLNFIPLPNYPVLDLSPCHRFHQLFHFSVCIQQHSLTLAAAKPSTTSSRSITLCMSSLSLCSASMICSCTCVSCSLSDPLSGLYPPPPPEACCPARLPLLYGTLPRHGEEITAAYIIMVPSSLNPTAKMFSTHQELPSNHASFPLFLVPSSSVVVHSQPPLHPAQHLAGSPGGQVCSSRTDSARCIAQELSVCKRQVK